MSSWQMLPGQNPCDSWNLLNIDTFNVRSDTWYVLVTVEILLTLSFCGWWWMSGGGVKSFLFQTQFRLSWVGISAISFQGFHVLHPVVLDMGVALFELMPWKAQPEVQVLAHYISLWARCFHSGFDHCAWCKQVYWINSEYLIFQMC